MKKNTLLLLIVSLCGSALLASSVVQAQTSVSSDDTISAQVDVAGVKSTTAARGELKFGKTPAPRQEKPLKSAEATNTEARKIQLKERALLEIDRRIAALNKLDVRVGSMRRVSAQGKNGIATSVADQIAALTALRAKIQAEADLTALSSDVKSITGSYRIYALVVPKGHIMAAADKITTTADLISTVAKKIQDRVTQLKAQGKVVASFETSLTTISSKVAQAKVEAKAAIDAVSTLVPDEKDETKAKANKETLIAAQAHIKVGNEALKAARNEADSIVKGIKALKV